MPALTEKAHVAARVAVQGDTAGASVPKAKEAQQISDVGSTRRRAREALRSAWSTGGAGSPPASAALGGGSAGGASSPPARWSSER